MTISRRDLLALAVTLPGFEALPLASSMVARSAEPLPQMPQATDEANWERIAREFVIDGVHLNTGTYGACPLSVLEATIHHMRAFERITTQEHPDLDALHQNLEEFLGAWPGSTAIVRNTTEAMNVAANGIDLVPGDEILATTHEHIGGRCCWELQAARKGAVLKTFDPPLDPQSPTELIEAWERQITPKTRVMSISHVLFTTGMIQPVKELVHLARSRGVISAVDGAHPPGMMQLDLRDINADYYSTSPHKWLLAPKGTGLLVVHPDRHEQTWPLIASGDWEAGDQRKFEHVGTSNESLVAGLAAAIDFQNAIGKPAIEARGRSLATRLMEMLSTIPNLRLVSPRDAASRSSMVSFTLNNVATQELQRILGRKKIRTRRISESGFEYLRLSTHIYVLPADLDRTVDLIREAARA